MYTTIIFVDLENIQHINDKLIKPQTKIFIMVGKGQDSKGFEILKEKWTKCDAIELIKVNGQGHNALDFFIAFYLGKFYNDINNAEVIICTKDGGYEPLKEHLRDKKIKIVRTGEISPKKKAIPPAQSKTTLDIMEKVNDVCNHFSEKKGAKHKHPRPRKLARLKSYLTKNLKAKLTENDIDKVIATMQEKGILIITDEKSETIRFEIPKMR